MGQLKAVIKIDGPMRQNKRERSKAAQKPDPGFRRQTAFKTHRHRHRAQLLVQINEHLVRVIAPRGLLLFALLARFQLCRCPAPVRIFPGHLRLDKIPVPGTLLAKASEKLSLWDPVDPAFENSPKYLAHTGAAPYSVG